MIKPIKIGKYIIKNPVFLAPMVDVTDLPFREICRNAGAGLTYTEMIYVDAITHPNPKTKLLMQISKKDSPSAIQITGNNIEEFGKVIPYLKKYDIVDLNCGCPSIRIVGNQAGSYLLKSPNKIANIIKLLKKEGLTVTAKIRIGFDKNNVLKIAKEIEKAGASAITLHPRLATQSYRFPADWSQIRLLKANLKIPLIGNGDIDSPAKAKEMLSIADGAMIGRAAIGNPYIFTQISHFLKTGKEIPFDFKKNLNYYTEYLSIAKKQPFLDIQRIKFIGSHFLKGIDGAAKMRNELMLCKSIDEIEKFIQDIETFNKYLGPD